MADPDGACSLLDRDPGDLREAVLKAAVARFLEVGVAQTRLNDVAELAGTSRPNIYRYFPGGKDEILQTVELLILRRFYDRVGARIPLRGDPEKVLARYILATVLDSPADEYAPLLVRPDIARWTSRFVAESADFHLLMLEYWQPILEYAERKGRLLPGLDRERAVRWLMLVMNACITMPEIVRTSEDLMHYVTHHIIPTILTPRPAPE